MERILLHNSNTEEAAERAAAVLQRGGVVLYPTDTLYGLGADALRDEAVAKIYSIKGRDEGKPIHAIVPNIAMAATYADVRDEAKTLLEKFGGKVTVIVGKKPDAVSGIVRDMETFGFRIPQNLFCTTMLRAFGKPITATSANASGEAPARTVDEILIQLGEAAARIDVVIDAGVLPASRPSSVVDLSGERPEVLREGAIAAGEIRAALCFT